MEKLPVTITGTVIHGNGLGSGVDIPTANIIPAEDVSKLNMGVYYSETAVDGAVYGSITNLGKKPTVKDDDIINAESFVYGFEGDLYGREIKVTLLEFKRPEMKFGSFDELVCQMKKDIEEGRVFSLQKTPL